MKLTAIFLLAACFSASAEGYSQGISLSLKNTALEKVIKVIEKQTDYYFAYTKETLRNTKPVSIEIQNGTIDDVLTLCFKGQPLGYSITDNVISIKRKVNVIAGSISEAISSPPAKGTIKGKVTNEDGEPIIGASVQLKNSRIGTSTNSNGEFQLDIPENSSKILVISYIGMQTKEVTVNSDKAINVVLTRIISQQDELVVVGYGTQRKRDITGSISRITSEEIEKSTIVSLDQALQGKAAGVFVNQSSSAPGGGISVRIRGGNSLQGGNEPLYVIDGIPIYNDNNEVNPGGGGGIESLRSAPNALASINPTDIESMEVLKDASATAIYGSRGANGVILITTKKGRSGTGRINFNTYQGLQNISKKIDLVNSSELMQWVNEGSNTQIFTSSEIANPEYDTDWQNLILNDNAPMSNYQLTTSGGTDKVRYLISGNYFNQQGIILNSDFKRYSGRVNVEGNINNWLNLGGNLFTAQTKNNRALDGGSGNANSSALFSALVYLPMLPVYNPVTGDYSRSDDFVRAGYSPSFRPNPVQLINEITDFTDGNRTLGDLNANINILKGLTFRPSFGVDVDAKERNYYVSNEKDPSSSAATASVGHVKAISWVNTNNLTYTKTYGEHRITAMGVYEVQKRTTDRSTIGNSIFDNNITQFYDIGAGNAVPSASTVRYQWTMQSYLARINYAFGNKYLLTASYRADGSSKFGANNRWAYFPSAAIAWRLSEEKFFKGLDFISNAKIRASAGKTGNQQIPVNKAFTTFVRGKYSFNGTSVNYYAPSVGNPNLKWETTNQYDVGLDLEFLNERITFTADAYYKKTTDLLMERTIPFETGYRRVLDNVGELENKGLEFSIGAQVFDLKEFKWKTQVNWATSKNKVLSLGKEKEIYGNQYNFDYGEFRSTGLFVRVGESVGSFYGLKYDGVYRTQAEIDAYPVLYGNNPPQLGSARYLDIAGPVGADGKPTPPDGKVDANDRVILGNAMPKFVYGWSNTFTYKIFELSAFIQGVYGNKILNLNKKDLYSEGFTQNISKERFQQAWRPGNEANANFPKASARVGVSSGLPTDGYSSFYVEDGSYLRLKDTRLSVELPFQTFKKRGLELKVYVAAQNLFTITDYTGYNPEVNLQGQDNVNQGIDMGSYPLAKTIMFGLTLSYQ